MSRLKQAFTAQQVESLRAAGVVQDITLLGAAHAQQQSAERLYFDADHLVCRHRYQLWYCSTCWPIAVRIVSNMEGRTTVKDVLGPPADRLVVCPDCDRLYPAEVGRQRCPSCTPADQPATIPDERQLQLFADAPLPRPPLRPSMVTVLMSFAEQLAARSTCQRQRVGAVLTDLGMLQVLGIGYNGNAAGLSNTCDAADAVGQCGCLHAEVNALLKAPGTVAKAMFITMAPCVMCAKAIINAHVVRVYYHRPYRLADGVQLLKSAGIMVQQHSV